jgi:hypothetical protein
LSTSHKRGWGALARRWLAAAAFCAVFGAVYEYFSHGVYSPYLYAAFAIPLAGGAGACGLGRLLGRQPPAAAVRQLYGAGIATLTVGSLMTGVFVIYGSAAPLVAAYFPAGALLLAAAGAAALAQRAGPPRA